jgi:hypothetical protein
VHHLEFEKKTGEMIGVAVSQKYGSDFGMVYFLP